MDDKYLYLPNEFHKLHDACFNLIREIEEFITEDIFQSLQYHAVSLNEEELQQLQNGKVDILQFLQDADKKEDHNRFVKNYLIYGLIIDNCYYLQEALLCSKKMRLAVTFSLLRRPLVYNMVIFLRLLLEEDFIDNFVSVGNGNEDQIFDVAKLPKNLKDLLINSQKHLITGSIEGEAIHNLIFDRSNPTSIINMTEKALHPITNRNKMNSTGAMNLNFVFMTQEDIHNLWKQFYSFLIPILMYYVDLIDTVTFAQLKLPKEKEILNNRLLTRIKYLSDIHS